MDQAQVISNASYHLGQIVAMEIYSNFLLERSGELFVGGKDELALLYRDLGKDLERESKQKRQDYETLSHPKKVEAYTFFTHLDTGRK